MATFDEVLDEGRIALRARRDREKALALELEEQRVAAWDELLHSAQMLMNRTFGDWIELLMPAGARYDTVPAHYHVFPFEVRLHRDSDHHPVEALISCRGFSAENLKRFRVYYDPHWENGTLSYMKRDDLEAAEVALALALGEESLDEAEAVMARADAENPEHCAPQEPELPDDWYKRQALRLVDEEYPNPASALVYAVLAVAQELKHVGLVEALQGEASEDEARGVRKVLEE